MDKGKVLTLDLPSEIIKKIDASPISSTKRGHSKPNVSFFTDEGTGTVH